MANKDNGLTPMKEQFSQLKAKHPDTLMLFRCGDFYVTYCEDAVAAAKILGITLTRRNDSTGITKMAGFPYHALDTYLPKLIRAGKRIAICDQLEDPKITELITPGVAKTDSPENDHYDWRPPHLDDNERYSLQCDIDEVAADNIGF